MKVDIKQVHLYDSYTGVFIESYSSMRELERAQGLFRGKVRDIINKNPEKGKLLVSFIKYDVHPLFAREETSNAPEPLSELKTLTEDELKMKHDLFTKILGFIKEIPGGRFIDEATMLRSLGLYGKPRYREALSRPELKDMKGRVDGVTYYGPAEGIKKLKQEGVLQ